jgi:hypothetical protein
MQNRIWFNVELDRFETDDGGSLDGDKPTLASDSVTDRVRLAGLLNQRRTLKRLLSWVDDAYHQQSAIATFTVEGRLDNISYDRLADLIHRAAQLSIQLDLITDQVIEIVERQNGKA